jgi:uncharacterized damage-inducible protein DinB
MNSQLQKLYNQIENQRDDILKHIENLSREELNRRPFPGKWSISEIISHLITAEQLSVNYIRKKIQGVDKTQDSGLWEEGKMLVLKVSQRIEGLKFRAPQYVKKSTVVHSDLETLKTEWMKTRNEFKKLLETIEDKHLKRKIYKHVVAGYLNIRHALLFFGEHVTHHTPQIKKITRSL